jgi:rhodanese-related sulfurtransferase
LRARHGELRRERDLWICCVVGQRAYHATRFLAQHGYQVRNLSEGYTTYKALKPSGVVP